MVAAAPLQGVLQLPLQPFWPFGSSGQSPESPSGHFPEPEHSFPHSPSVLLVVVLLPHLPPHPSGGHSTIASIPSVLHASTSSTCRLPQPHTPQCRSSSPAALREFRKSHSSCALSTSSPIHPPHLVDHTPYKQRRKNRTPPQSSCLAGLVVLPRKWHVVDEVQDQVMTLEAEVVATLAPSVVSPIVCVVASPVLVPLEVPELLVLLLDLVGPPPWHVGPVRPPLAHIPAT